MDARQNLMIFGLGLCIVALTAAAWAGGVHLPLTAAKAHPEASGKAYLSAGRLSIEAGGLRPDAVYTVWFVNMRPKKEETGAGSRPYMFKTDPNGKGSYVSALSESPFGKWKVLMIVLHPTGDPMDMKNMVGALKTMIPKSET
jgi:hypothetical protein